MRKKDGNYWAKKLRELREEANLTQKEMAKELGVAFRTYTNWEYKVFAPSPLAQEKIQQYENQTKKKEVKK